MEHGWRGFSGFTRIFCVRNLNEVWMEHGFTLIFFTGEFLGSIIRLMCFMYILSCCGARNLREKWLILEGEIILFF